MFWNFRINYYIFFYITSKRLTPDAKTACKVLKPLFTPHLSLLGKKKNESFFCVDMHTSSNKSTFMINIKKIRRVRCSEWKHLFDTYTGDYNAQRHAWHDLFENAQE